jgi:hypothetical protein
VPDFKYTLECDVEATSFLIRNTHNGIANDAGTKDLTIVYNDFWLNYTLEDPRQMVIIYAVDQISYSEFFKIYCYS